MGNSGVEELVLGAFFLLLAVEEFVEAFAIEALRN